MKRKIMFITLFLVSILLGTQVEAQVGPNYWNETWLNRTNITVQEISGYSLDYVPFVVNVSNAAITNCDSLRLTNVACSGSSPVEKAFDIDLDGSSSNFCILSSQVNLTASSNTSLCLYYNNDTVVGRSTNFSLINNTEGSGTSRFIITTDMLRNRMSDGGVLFSIETDSDGTNWVAGSRAWDGIIDGGGEVFGVGKSGYACVNNTGFVSVITSCEDDSGFSQNFTFYKQGYFWKVNISSGKANELYYQFSENGNLHGVSSNDFGIASNFSGSSGDISGVLDKGYAGYYSTDTTWYRAYIYDESNTNFEARKFRNRAGASQQTQFGNPAGTRHLNGSLTPMVYYEYLVNTTGSVGDADWNATYLAVYSVLIENPPLTFADFPVPIFSIDVINPVNNSIQQSLPININVTTSLSALSCSFNLDNGVNISMSNSSTTNWFSQTNETLINGTEYQILVYCADINNTLVLNNETFFTFIAPPNVVNFTVSDEITLDPILQFDIDFLLSGITTSFSTNKSNTNNQVGAQHVITTPEDMFDGDFDTFGDIVYIAPTLPGLSYSEGRINIENAGEVCIDYDCPDAAPNGCDGDVELLLENSSGTYLSIFSFSPGGTFTRNITCGDISFSTFDDFANYNLTYTAKQLGSGDANTKHLRIFELYNEFSTGSGEALIPVSLLDLGTNRIDVDESNGQYFNRFYNLEVGAVSNISLDTYLAPITSTTVIESFIVYDPFNSPLPGTSLSILKNIGGTFITIADDTTDDSGLASFRLIFQQPYRVSATSGSLTRVLAFTAAGAQREIRFNQSFESNFTAVMDGITMRVTPSVISFNSSETSHIEDFTFIIDSINGSLEQFGARLLCNVSTQINISNVTGSPSGGSVTLSNDIINCDNVSLEYYFTRTGFDEFTSTLFYTINREFDSSGLWKALELARGELDGTMLTFFVVIILIFFAAALARFGPEAAAIGEIVLGGVFTYAGWLNWYVYLLLTVAVFAVLMITRRFR